MVSSTPCFEGMNQTPGHSTGERAAAPAQPGGHQFERDLALELVDGDAALLLEIAAIYVRDNSNWMEEIRRAVETSDGMTLKRASHTLKGATSLFGARRVVEICQILELNAAQPSNLVEGSRNLVCELEASVLGLVDELRHFVQSSHSSSPVLKS